MTVGERIKQRRKELGMSADDLATRLGKNRATVFRYENGDIEKLPVDILKPIADALQTTPQVLMGWVSEETHKKNDIITDAVVRMRSDDEFLSVVSGLLTLDADKMSAVKQLLMVLQK
jgi:transcriptional regulator with XRE-family HTH domain